MINLPPALLYLMAAIACAVLPRRLAALIIPLVSAGILYGISEMPSGNLAQWSFLGYTLNPFYVDSLSRVFAVIFTLITGIAGIYGLSIFSKGEIIAALLYASGSLGVTFAGDYFTLYVFWELMAISSFYLIVARDRKSSKQAAIRYFFFHLTGGVLMLAGILMQLTETNSIIVEPLTPAASGGWLILIGVSINAAVVPLHPWLTDSYPKATIAGAALLSALTTKTALYALARIFPAWEILIPFGVLMAVYGVVFAFLADDIRTVLAYHIVSQVGFMVTGVGLGTDTAINGAVSHAFCHILYKALLFMATGAVLYTTGKSRLSELGGLFRRQPWIFILYMVGAVSISGLPLFNGFTSKSLTIYGAEQLHDYWVVTFLYVASVGTFLSVGIKLPYFAWFHKKSDVESKPLPQPMYLGMAITAIICFVLGVYPDLLYRALPTPVEWEPYTTSHVLHTCWFLAATGLGFYLYLPKIKMMRSYIIDFDWLYRHPVFYSKVFIEAPGKLFGFIERFSFNLAATLTRLSRNPTAYLTPAGMRGNDYDPDRQRLPIAWTVTAILASFLLFGILILLR